MYLRLVGTQNGVCYEAKTEFVGTVQHPLWEQGQTVTLFSWSPPLDCINTDDYGILVCSLESHPITTIALVQRKIVNDHECWTPVDVETNKSSHDYCWAQFLVQQFVNRTFPIPCMVVPHPEIYNKFGVKWCSNPHVTRNYTITIPVYALSSNLSEGEQDAEENQRY